MILCQSYLHTLTNASVQKKTLFFFNIQCEKMYSFISCLFSSYEILAFFAIVKFRFEKKEKKKTFKHDSVRLQHCLKRLSTFGLPLITWKGCRPYKLSEICVKLWTEVFFEIHFTAASNIHRGAIILFFILFFSLSNINHKSGSETELQCLTVTDRCVKSCMLISGSFCCIP